ncbi:hypothetical protein AB0L97_20220 [Nocardia sp. NPDC051911]|uniref:hypothetical protein n=1 Tax=Nocardia sp. NPDC051911 TaxID=3154648 RepID=UPI00342807AB
MTNDRLLDAIEHVDRAQQINDRERASRPDTINVEGRIYTLDANGEPATDRDRRALAAFAQSRADAAVRRGIDAHNREVHPVHRVEHRDATTNEVNAAYRQIIAEGRYRAEHGQSGDQSVDLGDVVNGELG